MFYVYVLKSEKNNKFYIGCTNNLNRRLSEHNSGASKYTKNKGPWKLEYSEAVENINEARKREKQIKSWKKRSAIERLINQAAIV